MPKGEEVDVDEIFDTDGFDDGTVQTNPMMYTTSLGISDEADGRMGSGPVLAQAWGAMAPQRPSTMSPYGDEVDASDDDDDDDLDFENFGEDSVSKHREKLLQKKQAKALEEKKAAMTPDNAAAPTGGQWSDPLAALEDGMGAVTNASLAAIIIKDNIELHKKINEQIEAGRKVIDEQAAVVTDEIPGFGALSIAAFAAVVLQDEANLLKKLEEDKAEMRRVNVLFDESQVNINTYEQPDPKQMKIYDDDKEARVAATANYEEIADATFNVEDYDAMGGDGDGDYDEIDNNGTGTTGKQVAASASNSTQYGFDKEDAGSDF